MLACGLDGIANQTAPPELFDGDVYAAKDLDRVPHTLNEALHNFSNSAFAKSAFGDYVVDHYRHFYTTERDAFRQSVTDWERQRYFERI